MDFMFELISPTKTLLYQAESEHDRATWVAVFANSTEYLLSLQKTRNDTEALEKNMDVKTIQLQKHVKQGLLAQLRKENPTCAEVGTHTHAGQTCTVQREPWPPRKITVERFCAHREK
jgi:hypothetical protein